MPHNGQASAVNQSFPANEFVASLNATLRSYLAQQRERVEGIAAEALELIENISALSQGGKRLRPLFAWYGWQIAGGDPASTQIRDLGISLELFQAAALIHDDILDRSDTRRGQPSAHRRFEQLHSSRRWDHDAEHFGVSGAILAGDLSLALCEEVFANMVLRIAQQDSAAAASARAVFDDMRFEVMTGQYLDVREESAGRFHSPELALDRAMTILRYKSAKYSVERPLMLGAAAAGASAALLTELSEFSLPLGEAFQLRDDQLGVFGDPAVTGKPAGDDLREGKRTALIAYARAGADEDQVALMEQLLGNAEMSDQQVMAFQEAIQQSGAAAQIEELISQKADAAYRGIAALACDEGVRTGLLTLAQATINRQK